MLGRDLTALLAAAGEEFTALARADLDVTDAAAVAAAVCGGHAGRRGQLRRLDRGRRRRGSTRTRRLAVNGARRGQPRRRLRRRRRAARPRLHRLRLRRPRGRPYAEDAPPAPAGAYGRTKLAGEQAVRAALPDAQLRRPHRLAVRRARQELRQDDAPAGRANGTAPGVVDDQHGQPTWTADVAGADPRADRRVRPRRAIYHATSSGQTTWFGFAEEIFAPVPTIKVKTRIPNGMRLTPRPITTADYPTPAQRPGYSVLGHDAWHAAGIEPIGDWKDALHRAFPAILAASAASAAAPVRAIAPASRRAGADATLTGVTVSAADRRLAFLPSVFRARRRRCRGGGRRPRLPPAGR